MGVEFDSLGNCGETREMARKHLHVAHPGWDIGGRGLVGDAWETLEHKVRSIDFYDCPDYLLNDYYKIDPISTTGRRPEGIIFGVENWDPPHCVVKLYNGTDISNSAWEDVLDILYPDKKKKKGGFRKDSVEEPNPVKEGVMELMAQPWELAHYYCSAELLVRTLAHEVMPDALPLPIAITKWDEAVGLILPSDRAVARALNMGRVVPADSAFGIFYEDSWELSFQGEKRDLPPGVESLLKKLDEYNVHVWSEDWRHLSGQYLVDMSGNFVNFARLGYVTRRRLDSSDL